MRDYECICTICGKKRQIRFKEEPYPNVGEKFLFACDACGKETEHTRVLTRKTVSELNRIRQENDLRNSISEKCMQYGFKCRFLYQSVIITTPVADWCFDYHLSTIKLFHESTIKINFENGNYAKSHLQFENEKMTPLEVIDYIKRHDAWREKMNKRKLNK